ncbi:hypothetical protein [uncultured Polaribacter sp.]|uniref:hypothetical protein n=1 Tax=uncultured Polaribacter sp. TaxID=174711 RepID=UPI002625F562|nr:hypothetical protein [uncultured Polaribacter sp.]
MKTSRYIHLIMLVFIFGATLTLFINAKNHKEKLYEKPKYTYQQKKLPLFSVIVVNENAKISLYKNKFNMVSCSAKNNKIIPEDFSLNNFSVRNDTLFVKETNQDYSIYISAEKVKTIIGLENSKIDLKGFYSDSLRINLTKSKLTGSIKADSIKSFSLSAQKQSYVRLNKNVRVITINNQTKKKTYTRDNAHLNNVDINLKDKSKLWMPKPKNLTIQTDSLSIYNLIN